ncbi:hypothetical protein M2272_005388 [Mycobacterium frederiksbergense]|uniref:Uncharacterized protein n=1 Tax=Mycolicibacterium frederiksbergense TaxID=117567 RepID=A0ABT6L700_9MYCO|nr:hypothetical protein [Mycolicibacterium frederiksbergense]MDH6198728.1 hypothetical protein [Mycolicibacterium frederiksbergense]
MNVGSRVFRAGFTNMSGPNPGHGFTAQPRRWVIKPTNGWINHRRRIDRHDEITLVTHEGFNYLSQIALLPKRLDRSQLFETRVRHAG